MKTLRKRLFWCLVLAYAVCCPLLILHVLGYVNTGLIIIDTDSAKVLVLLDGQPVANELPVTIPHIRPGEYRIGIELAGYQPWSRQVTVQQGQACVITQVTLLPTADSMTTISDTPFAKLHPIERTPYMLLLPTGSAAGARVFNHQDKRLSRLLPIDSPSGVGSIRRVFSVPESPYVLVEIEDDDHMRYVWIALDEEPTNPQDITALLSSSPAEVLWSAQAPEQLFCFARGTVDRVDLKGETNQVDFASGWIGLGVFGDTVSGLDAEGRFIRMTMEGELVTTEAGELDLTSGLFQRLSFIHILRMPDDTLLFHEAGGRLLQTELPHMLIDKRVDGVRCHDKDARALVWQPDALGILESPARRGDGEVFEAGRQVRWLFKGKEHVTSPYFLNGGSHAVCLLGNAVTVFDLRAEKDMSDPPGQLFNVYPNAALQYVEDEGMLYALHPDNAHLVAVRLLPVRTPSEQRLPSNDVENGGGE